MEERADTRTWLVANADFHVAVYQHANRPRMIELVERLRMSHRPLFVCPP